MKKWLTLLFVFTCLPAMADVEVHHAYVRATPPGAPNGAAFMILKNTADKAVSLEKVESPVANKTELHNHIEANDMMQMRQVESVAVPANSTVALKSGGYHAMLIGLKEQLIEGTEVMFMFHFSDGSMKHMMLPVKRMQSNMSHDEGGDKAEHNHAVQSSETMGHEHQHKSTKPTGAVRVTGIIKEVLPGKHQLKVLHDPIKEWDMGGMQMKFHVLPAIDIQHLKPGQRITFMLRNEGLSRFVLTELMGD